MGDVEAGLSSGVSSSFSDASTSEAAVDDLRPVAERQGTAVARMVTRLEAAFAENKYLGMPVPMRCARVVQHPATCVCASPSCREIA